MKKKSLEETAKALADEHVKADPEITQVFLARSDDVIRIVEITGSVGTTRQIIPFSFERRPDLGIPYPSKLILLSKEELGLLKSKQLNLPSGWGGYEDLTSIYNHPTRTKNGQKRRRVG